MGRDHTKENLSRKKTPTNSISQFILFVEGRNTERSYFNLLKQSCCTVIPMVVKGHGISSCLDFVNDAMSKFNHFSVTKKKKFAQKWLVFDYDGHKDFPQAIRLARNNGFRVAFSSMCIEYWFDLHFIEHDGKPIPMVGGSHSKAQINILNNFINRYNKTANTKIKLYDDRNKNVETDLFELMLSINPVTNNRRIVDAYIQAEAHHSQKVQNGCEFNESVTTIYELLRELGVISFNDGSYTVNIK